MTLGCVYFALVIELRWAQFLEKRVKHCKLAIIKKVINMWGDLKLKKLSDIWISAKCLIFY